MFAPATTSNKPMNTAFRKVLPSDIDEHIKPILIDLLRTQLSFRQPGHCMRVGDLSTALMEDIARSLASQTGNQAQVHVLTSAEHGQASPLFITSSKLVELRNPLGDGRLRPPLLVFVPNDLRTSAEDSFAEATFERIDISEAYPILFKTLLEMIPAGTRTYVEECIRFLRERDWKWADEAAHIRFLLSIKLNGYDPEVVGASLCEYGLIPDFSLLDDPSIVSNRLVKNLESAKVLAFSPKSEIGRVLELKIESQEVRSGLIAFFTNTSLEDPITWAARIVCEPENYPLSFDKWGAGAADDFTQKIQVHVQSVEIPIISDEETDPKLKDLKGERVLVLGGNGPQSFRVKFRCVPAPESIPDLDHFRLTVVSREQGPTGAVKKKKSWMGSRMDATQSFTRIRSMDWEDGWHFIRVLPCRADGDVLPMVDSAGKPVPVFGEEGSPAPPHESDFFYVLRDADVEIEVPQRAIPRFPSLEHALIHQSFKAVIDGTHPAHISATRVNWLDSESSSDKHEMVEFKFSGEGSVNIPITRPLRLLEQVILQPANNALSWTMSLNHKDDPVVVPNSSSLPHSLGLGDFLALRSSLFSKIRGEDQRGLVELAPLASISELIVQYAEQYLEVLSRARILAESCSADRQREAVSTLQELLTIDTVSVILTDYRGGRRSAVLAAPTHPIRMLWLVTWSALAKHWIDQLTDSRIQYAASSRDSFYERLSMVNFPTSFATSSGRIVQAVDNIHPLWTIYATTDEADPRGLVAELCTALGLPEPTIGSFTVNGSFLANRIRRYLAQHPYVDTLSINCFNSGRGKILADALLEIQAISEYGDLRYDIRLFVGNPEAPGIGDDLAELISPSSSLTAVEADAFAVPTGIHLSPKLTFSVRSDEDFQANPAKYPAHLSLLFDVFPAKTVSAVEPDLREEAAPIHGLLQDYSITYEEEESRVAWHRCPRHGGALPIPGREDLASLLSGLANTCSAVAATVATGQTGLNIRPISTLVLGPDQKALLHQVHEVSDWVFTIDKSMGIEFFDHDRKIHRPEYLIDHSPDLTTNSGRRVVISSRSQTEIRVLFEQVLAEHGLSEYVSRSAAILSELRALSGRFALKLASTCTHRAEAFGLALAKLFLQFQSAFENQVVVPLDSHLDLFLGAQRQSNDIADEISLKRTDLAIFDIDSSTMTLTCRLVEVKCYKNAGGPLSSLDSLRANIAEQLLQSEKALRQHFEPQDEKDRPDRVLKTQELITLLEFYLERAKRLGFLAPEPYEEAKYFLRSMQCGYKIRFTRSALIFDFDKTGQDEHIEENGIEFHRIGLDLIKQLLNALPQSSGEVETIPFEAFKGNPESTHPEADVMTELATGSFPRLESAGFLAADRPHTAPWELLRARITTDEQDAIILPTIQGVVPAIPAVPPTNDEDQPAENISVKPPVEPPGSDQPAEGSGLRMNRSPEFNKETNPDSQEVHFDVMLGASGPSPQFGVLGKVHGRMVALDLNQTQTISLFGVQGGGKSYTLGSIIEMATMAIPGINVLPKPLATVVFHFSQTQDYKPEFTSMNRGNADPASIESLLKEYSAKPAGLKDILLLTPEAKVDERKAEYPDIEVLPLKFASSELQAAHWRFLMGAVGNQATYIRRLNQIMRGMRGNLTLGGLRQAVQDAGFPDSLRDLSLMRLDLAATYIDDSVRLSETIRPGRLLIVDLRDEFIEKDEALGLFVVLLQLFADATCDGEFFNKLVVFDEAHKYVDNPDLVDGLISVVREMRHKGTSILVASQDPPSVPVSLIELSTQIILHRFNSPAWLKHIQKANAALLGLRSEQLARLRPGEALMWSAKATDQSFSNEALKIHCRPRVTHHGGDTKSAVR